MMAWAGGSRRFWGLTPSEVIRYVYDNEDIVLEYRSSTAKPTENTLAAHWVHGPGIDEPLAVELGLKCQRLPISCEEPGRLRLAQATGETKELVFTKQLKLFLENPRHPSLRIHRYKSESDVLEAYEPHVIIDRGQV